jgi:hypothetical protein
MRTATFAIIGMLATGLVFPAAAENTQSTAKAAHNSFAWEQCHMKALRFSRSHGRHSTDEYMKRCLAEKAER